MSKRFAVPFVAVMLAACAPAVVGTGPDFANGMWGEQPIVPPPGLLTARQGDLIGRTISTPGRPNLMTVEAVLVDPYDGQPEYVVATTRSGYVTIPMSVLVPTATGFHVDATDYSLGTLRHMDVAQLEAYYPRTTLTPVAVPLPGMAGAYPPGTGEPLHLLRRGDMVGHQVVDAYGAIVGTVDSVAAVPATGEARFLIVSGPPLGPGNFIAVPAASGQTQGNRFVVAGTATGWLQMPHYRSDQLVQVFGPVADGQ